jgi:KaiC/GvpD/RAD55 family RecA-like ATPase
MGPVAPGSLSPMTKRSRGFGSIILALTAKSIAARRSRRSGGGASVNRLYVPPTLGADILADARRALYATEGEFKSLKGTQEGFPTVALPGVWSWKRRLHDQSLPIPDLDRIEWRDRVVVVVFDSDAAIKPPVAWAEHELVKELRRREARIFVIRLPEGDRGEKYGFDDYLVAMGAEAFRRLPMLSLQDADDARPTFLRMSDLAEQYLERATTTHNRIKFNNPGLDGVIRGIAPGEVVTVLGRSGVGKTAFALNLIDSMTTASTLPTLVFSLEMQGLELFERMTSIQTGIPGQEIEALATREDALITDRFIEACEHWHHVVVVDRPCSLESLDKLVSEARVSDLWVDPLRLVVIDYMGMIGLARRGTLYEQVSEVARELKRIAKRHLVALVVLCQVGRTGESGGEPITLTSARDSGVIEEAADYIIGIWRPELQTDISLDEREARRGILKAAVLKNRCGPAPRTFEMRFESSTLKISGGIVDIGEAGG